MLGSDNKLDQLIMLLSSDWFFPHWSLFGIAYDVASKEAIQRAARETVQDFMAESKVYWHISFSNERVRLTRARFLEHLARVGVIGSQVSLLIERMDKIHSDDGGDDITLWLLSSLTELLVKDQVSAPRVDQHTLTLIKEAFSKSSDYLDFESVNMDSMTSWDRYLRNLTPDLPTMLSDFLAAEFQQPSSFRRFWHEAEHFLAHEQRRELVAWYAREAQVLADPAFHWKPPVWMEKS